MICAQAHNLGSSSISSISSSSALSSPNTLSNYSRIGSPVILAGGSIQSMVTEGSLTEGPNEALIAGAIGATIGALLVVLGIFFPFYRIRRCAATRDVNVEKEDREEDSKRHSRSRNATPASLRPVSVFSDTTIDSSETRENFKNKLRRKDSVTKSLGSLGGGRGRSEEGERDGGSSPLVARLENLSQTFVPSSPTSTAVLSSPSPTTPSYSTTHLTSQIGSFSRGGGTSQPIFQAQSQVSFPPPSHFANQPTGGYAAALQRAGGSPSSPQSPLGPAGSVVGGSRLGGGRVAEPYEEKNY
ncbi:hypothetical protein JCM5350_007821 [Sporobolomyces pararoseus]